jgi:HTH-type transcriptional regulator/antitoxin HigA
VRKAGKRRVERAMTMNVKIIKSAEDYEAAMARLSELMSLDPGADSKEENELELLALVIQDFERQTVPPVKADPIESILFRMDQMQLSRKDLIPYIGSISKVSEVLSRKRSLSLPMIRRLNRGLGIPADILIEDVETDCAVVEQEPEMDFTRFPLGEMLERGCFGDFDGNAQRLKEYAEDLVRKFMQDLMPRQASPAFLRAPMHQRGDRQANDMALKAWHMCVLRKARAVSVTRDYRRETITPDWLRELARLSSFDEGPKLARAYLARHGITLVIEKHFKRTFLDGAALLDGDRPIVALTLRHDRLDNFWFALLHELAHVARHLSSRVLRVHRRPGRQQSRKGRSGGRCHGRGGTDPPKSVGVPPRCGKHCSPKTPSPSPTRSACIRPSWQDVCATKQRTSVCFRSSSARRDRSARYWINERNSRTGKQARLTGS